MLYKTAYYSFYLPVALAMYLCGISHPTSPSPSTQDPYAVASSILLPLPPPLPPLSSALPLAALGPLLAPLPHALAIARASVGERDGPARELARRAWAKARTSEPFVLGWRVGARMWGIFWGEGKEK